MTRWPTSKIKPKPNFTPEPPRPEREWQFTAIGTAWWIGLYQPVDDTLLRQLQEQISKLVETFDSRYSRFRPDSLVSQWARKAGSYPLPPDAGPLLDIYRRLYDVTDGAVTPLIGQLLSDAGYDARYSLQPKPTRRPPSWDEVLRYSDSEITLLKPALLDFGAAGKGYLVDQVCRLLQEQGITDYCVDASGDMCCNFSNKGHKTIGLAIGLEHPADPSQVIGVANLNGGALCGSAGNRRAWGDTSQDGQEQTRYTHIMSPFTRQSPRHLQAVWVTAETALLADGLTTALYFTEPAKLRQTWHFEYAMMAADNSLEVSEAFPAQFFTGQQT